MNYHDLIFCYQLLTKCSLQIRSSPDPKQRRSHTGFATGMIEPRYEGHYEGGYSPHMWSGSVQIIEEFLRRGATPVKYSQCWVMACLMTSCEYIHVSFRTQDVSK